MKEGIHPHYVEAQVQCACGNNFVTRSTLNRIRVEICSACHPFYTGKQKLVDTAGRLERFQKRFAKTEGKMVTRKPTTTKAAPKESSATRRILRNVPRVTAPEKPSRGPKGPKGKTAR
jgi:large subunit ribosomal protein L31